MTENKEVLFNSSAEIERLRDLLSEGLPDAEDLPGFLVSAGVTLSRLFDNSQLPPI